MIERLIKQIYISDKKNISSYSEEISQLKKKYLSKKNGLLIQYIKDDFVNSFAINEQLNDLNDEKNALYKALNQLHSERDLVNKNKNELMAAHNLQTNNINLLKKRSLELKGEIATVKDRIKEKIELLEGMMKNSHPFFKLEKLENMAVVYEANKFFRQQKSFTDKINKTSTELSDQYTEIKNIKDRLDKNKEEEKAYMEEFKRNQEEIEERFNNTTLSIELANQKFKKFIDESGEPKGLENKIKRKEIEDIEKELEIQESILNQNDSNTVKKLEMLEMIKYDQDMVSLKGPLQEFCKLSAVLTFMKNITSALTMEDIINHQDTLTKGLQYLDTSKDNLYINKMNKSLNDPHRTTASITKCVQEIINDHGISIAQKMKGNLVDNMIDRELLSMDNSQDRNTQIIDQFTEIAKMQNIIAAYSDADKKKRNVMEAQFKDIQLKRIEDWIWLKAAKNRIAEEKINDEE